MGSFLSRFKQLTLSLSDKVKVVSKRLDDIASNSNKFMFKFPTKPTKFIKPYTSSLVSVNNPIIGRGDDLEKVVEMLLADSDDVSSLAIVGMGGLGKTALAQLVYNDPRITSAFQLKIWTCISDQWNLTELLGKIVRELDRNNHDLTSLEQMHREIRKQLEGKKCLLVLDDVWTESYREWQELENYLMVGGSGSRIVVTTRSKITAEFIGGDRVHELQGLSEEESWHLFLRMAFRPKQRENLNEDFVKLGKDIVKKCFNVPLAIRVVGSLLHGASEAMWISFRDKELADISERVDTMNKILSLSYHQLDSSLKSCFAYCAIFPKDFQIDKHMLISLWMAQGYINEESDGEEYFLILLQRCFFQDIKENDIGGIISFKMHDLLHDIAQQAAGKEVCRLTSDPDRKVRHVGLLYGSHLQGTFNKTHIRTCLQVMMSRSPVDVSDWLLAINLITNWTSLRSLDLSYLKAKSLPEAIGKLIHLRYLNLSRSFNLKVLPNSFTKLVNLQTLILLYCFRLRELPKDMCKLVDLSTLDLTNCIRLSHMPSKLGLLTNLHTLGRFVVGGESSDEKQCFYGLEDLGSLKNLKGSLQIDIKVRKNTKYVKEDHGGGAYLMSMVHLNEIEFHFGFYRSDESIEWEQALLEKMQPHDNIRRLFLRDYNGETMPR